MTVPTEGPFGPGIKEMLFELLDEAQASLDSLAPYNGTVPGARAIGKARDKRDNIQAEIDRRGLTR